MEITRLENDAAYVGDLPEGCKHCAEGSKMVLLVTGNCEGGCWYCPLSEKKKDRSVVYADEKKVECDEEIINEAESIDATGTGITGGDPLSTDRTLHYIRLLKEEFGDDHHIHLYTQSTDIDKIQELSKAGLDEIRFHPPVKTWDEIEKSDYKAVLQKVKEDIEIDIGIEIPSIPDRMRETVHLLKEVEGTIDFVNINELEFSSTNSEELIDRGYEHKSDVSSAVEGSQELALKLLDRDFDFSIHYCSLGFKDGVQLSNRIKRRAENVAKKSDIITEEGTLIRGVIDSDDRKIMDDLREIYDLDKESLWYDEDKKCIICPLPLLREISQELDVDCYGVEIYPTSDSLEVERWPL